MKTLERLCRDHDVALVVGSPLVDAEPRESAIELVTPHERIVAETVVNASGLYADTTSAMLGGMPFTIYPCRGEYAELAPSRRAMVNGLVYPLPHASGAGLGVHLAKTTWGTVTLGPTIHYQSSKDDYEGGRLPLEAFVANQRSCCCHGSRWPIYSRVAAAFAPSCTGRIRSSPIS